MTYKKRVIYYVEIQTIDRLREMGKKYNRSMSELVDIAIDVLYTNDIDITNDYSLLDKIKQKIDIKSFCETNLIKMSDFYRVIRALSHDKTVGAGNNTRRIDLTDKIYKTESARIASLLEGLI